MIDLVGFLKEILIYLFCFFLLQIAPSAKKLWGVEEQRDDKGLLHLSDHQMWRDSTWSIAGMLTFFLREREREKRIERRKSYYNKF